MTSVTYRFLFYLLKYTYGIALRRRFAITATGQNLVSSLDPPYLLLANHVNMWDPPIVAAFLRHPPHFLATDNIFRSTVTRFFYRLLGAIPKAKDQPDLAAVALARRVVRGGGVVAVFPEGRRTWDGRTLPLHPATARLPRLLGTRVITADIEGGYLSRPRWARYGRRGRMVVHYSEVATAREATTMSVSEMEERLDAALYRDADASQERRPVCYRGRRRAEYIEIYLVCCPCGSMGSYRSRGHVFRCASCGRRGWITEYGRIEGYEFETITDLADWQEPQLTAYLAEWPGSERMLRQPGVRLLRAIGRHSHRPLASGEAVLRQGSLRVGSHRIRLEQVHACNMQNDNSVEFSLGRYRYRLEQPSRSVQYHRAPYYLWMRVIQECARAFREAPAELTATAIRRAY